MDGRRRKSKGECLVRIFMVGDESMMSRARRDDQDSQSQRLAVSGHGRGSRGQTKL
jgi:hypothetical protein